jgi:hypothetical protein
METRTANIEVWAASEAEGPIVKLWQRRQSGWVSPRSRQTCWTLLLEADVSYSFDLDQRKLARAAGLRLSYAEVSIFLLIYFSQ